MRDTNIRCSRPDKIYISSRQTAVLAVEEGKKKRIPSSTRSRNGPQQVSSFSFARPPFARTQQQKINQMPTSPPPSPSPSCSVSPQTHHCRQRQTMSKERKEKPTQIIQMVCLPDPIWIEPKRPPIKGWMLLFVVCNRWWNRQNGPPDRVIDCPVQSSFSSFIIRRSKIHSGQPQGVASCMPYPTCGRNQRRLSLSRSPRRALFVRLP